MKTKTRTVVGSDSSVAVVLQSPAISSPAVTAPLLSADLRGKCLERINSLYADSIQQGATLVETMIGLGQCVSEFVATVPFITRTSGLSAAKQIWEDGAKKKQLPFGWVQALRYKKIFEHKDEVRKQLQSMAENGPAKLTVEKAYKIAGTAFREAHPQTPKPKAVYSGTVFGVDNEALAKKREEWAKEIEAAKQRIEKLKELDRAMDTVQDFVNVPNPLGGYPFNEDTEAAFKLVGSETEAVAKFHRLRESYRHYGFGDHMDDFKEWLCEKYADNVDVLIAKIEGLVRSDGKRNEGATLSEPEWPSAYEKILAQKKDREEQKKKAKAKYAELREVDPAKLYAVLAAV